MKDEAWLKKIKENLDDYSAPLPQAGWEKLEQALPRRKLIPFRLWAMVAAALLVGAVSFIGLRLADNNLPDSPSHILPAATPQVADKLPVQATPQTSEPLLPPVRLADVLLTDAAVQTNILAHTETEEREEEKKSEETKEKESHTPGTSKSETKKSTELPDVDQPLLAMSGSPRARSGKGWSIGISVGNTGGFGYSPDGDGPQHFQQSDLGTGHLNLDLAATSNGILTIPKGQELVFQNGLPYLQSRSRRIVSIDHKQPVSAGFSLRKNLPKGFSVETGLVYTFLASDILYEGDAEKTSQKLHYLGIPIRGNWNFVDAKRFTLYVSAGGVIEKCVYGKIGTEKETVDPVQLSVMASVGAQYNLGRHVGVYLEPGVSYFFDDGSELQTIRKDNPCNFTLQAGLRLSY